MTRDEHLAWCKERAIREMEFTGDPKQGVVSMLSDLRKHPETAHHSGAQLGAMLLAGGHLDTDHAVRDFIKGFN